MKFKEYQEFEIQEFKKNSRFQEFKNLVDTESQFCSNNAPSPA
jgi:hypothetical protein